MQDVFLYNAVQSATTSLILIIIFWVLILCVNIIVLIYSVQTFQNSSRIRGAESAKTLSLIGLILAILSFFIVPILGTIIAFILEKIASKEIRKQIKYNKKHRNIDYDEYE